MPLYEYECSQCEKIIEKLQKVSDAPIVLCPNCQQSTLKKIVSKTDFRLKGQGWYETDFKKDKKTSEKPAEKTSQTKNQSASQTSVKKTTSSGGSESA